MKITKKQYLEAVHVIELYREQLKEELKEVEEIIQPEIETKVIYTEETYLEETDISMRLLRCTRYALNKKQPQFKDLKNLRESKVLRWRNIGYKSVKELKLLMAQAGLELKK